MEFTADALALAPWSHTKANCAHTCPFAFYKKYVERIKGVEPLRIENQIGKIVHTILEWCLRGMSVSFAYNKALTEIPMLSEVEVAIGNYREAVTDFVKGVNTFKTRQGVLPKDVLVEQKIGLDANFRSTDYWNRKGARCVLRGATDLTLVTRDRLAVIIDHKTGTKKAQTHYDRQTTIYGLLTDAACADLRNVRAAIHYVGEDPNTAGKRTVWGDVYSVDAVRTRFREDVTEWLNEAARKAGTMEVNKSWMCNFCNYTHICPNY